MIVATGASALWLGLDSETRLRGRGVSACATCDGFFFQDREIAVVGGGDTAFEEATYLTRFATKVHLLHRRDTFRASKIMVDRAQAHPKIEIHTNTAVEEVLGDDEGRRPAAAATPSPATRRTMPIEGLFIAIGYRPNTEAFRDWLDVDEKGYLVVHDETGSKIDGVFIAGDVHDHRYRQAVTAAADGCKAAIDAERWLESAGHHRSRDRHRLVTAAALRAPAPLRHRADGPGAGPHRARRGDHPGVGRACGQSGRGHGRGQPRRMASARSRARRRPASRRSTPAAAGCRT